MKIEIEISEKDINRLGKYALLDSLEHGLTLQECVYNHIHDFVTEQAQIEQLEQELYPIILTNSQAKLSGIVYELHEEDS